jgi:hypothetical protein
VRNRTVGTAMPDLPHQYGAIGIRRCPSVC